MNPLRRSRRDRGVALVEGAIAFPLVLLITMAVIEFGLVFSTESTTTASAQAGARLGAASIPLAASPDDAFDSMRDDVVEHIDALTGQGTPQELWIYEANADGAPAGGFSSCSTSCRRYLWDGTTFTNPTGTWSDPDACPAGGLDVVGVYVKVSHRMVSGMFFDDLDVSEHSTAQLEPLPTEQCLA